MHPIKAIPAFVAAGWADGSIFGDHRSPTGVRWGARNCGSSSSGGTCHRRLVTVRMTSLGAANSSGRIRAVNGSFGPQGRGEACGEDTGLSYAARPRHRLSEPEIRVDRASDDACSRCSALVGRLVTGSLRSRCHGGVAAWRGVRAPTRRHAFRRRCVGPGLRGDRTASGAIAAQSTSRPPRFRGSRTESSRRRHSSPSGLDCSSPS
jgi:hypothetical protein